MPVYEQTKQSTAKEGQKSNVTSSAVVNASDAGARREQVEQDVTSEGGLDLAHGATSELLARGESATDKAGFANDPYGTFNYYHGSKLGSSYYGKIDDKLISEHTLGRLKELSAAETTLNISYYDGDAPTTKTGRLFALGKYQIVPDTLKDAQSSLGLSDDTVFSNDVQDRMFTEYLITDKKQRGAIIDYITGKSTNIDAAARAIAQEWASVGIKPGTSGAHKTGEATGLTSYYEGDGINTASISYFEICDALNADRDAVASGGVATHTVSQPTTVNTPTQSVPETSTESAQQNDTESQAQDLPELSKGDSGPDVEKMQNLLIKAGYSLDPYGADGSFGGTTKRVVKKFQSDHSLNPDGTVGPLTWAALLESSAKATSETTSTPDTTNTTDTTTTTDTTPATNTTTATESTDTTEAPTSSQEMDDVESQYTESGTISYDKNPGQTAVKVLQHYLNKYLGDFGEAVNDLKLSDGKLDEDGSLGWRSYQALLYFQFSRGLWTGGYTHGMAIDGVCGPATWNALRTGASKVHDLDKGCGYKDGQETDVPEGDIGEGGHRISAAGAEQYKAMKAAAASDGVTLKANSSFRSLTTSGTTKACGGEEHSGCIELYVDYRIGSGINGRNEAATPGNSNHCFGNAIDFKDIPKKPSDAEGNKAFEWLRVHAADYHFENYAPEGWHWNYVG